MPLKKSLRGHFLVASPHLLDPNFARAVVLLIQHNKEGALGVVLNRSIEKTVQEHGMIRAHLDRFLRIGAQHRLIVDDLHAAPAEHE